MLRSIAASKLCKIYVGICSFPLVQWSIVSCQPLVKRISRKLRNDCHSIFSRTQKKYEACFNKTSPPPSTQKCHALTRTKGYIKCHLNNMCVASNGFELVEQNDLLYINCDSSHIKHLQGKNNLKFQIVLACKKVYTTCQK